MWLLVGRGEALRLVVQLTKKLDLDPCPLDTGFPAPTLLGFVGSKVGRRQSRLELSEILLRFNLETESQMDVYVCGAQVLRRRRLLIPR